MYTVIFNSWTNNCSEYLRPEEYDSMDEAIERAIDHSTFTVTYIGDNSYINDGIQTWVEDESGNTIFEAKNLYIDETK